MDGRKLAMASRSMATKKISGEEITAEHKKKTEGEQNMIHEEYGLGAH